MKLISILCTVSSAGLADEISQDQHCLARGSYLVEKGVEDGNVGARFYLGKALLFEGCGPQARLRGLTLLEGLADEEHAPAMFLVGKLLLGSAETEAEDAAGLRLVRESAELGHPDAEALYGLLLLSSASGQSDREKALYWLGSAAGKGVVSAAQSMAVIYAQGMHGLSADQCLASIWNEAAALLADPMASLPSSATLCQ